MSNSPVLCPYCNAQVDGVRDPAKPVCPRCESPLPASVAQRFSLAGEVTSRSVAEPDPRTANRKTARMVLGVMAAMALIAVGFTLWTKNFRRENDHKKGYTPTEALTQAPDEAASLGYIPIRCNILGAINLVDARANKVIKAALLDDPPRSLAFLRDQLKDSTGLTPDDIDHVAIGVELTDQAPKILVVLQTKVVYDSAAILKVFGDKKPQSLRGRPMVRFSLPQVGQGAMWCFGDRFIAFLIHIEGRAAEEFEAIPKEPRKNIEGLPDSIQRMFAEKVDKQAIAWLAADMSRAAGLVDFLTIVGARIEAYRPVLESKAVVVNMKTDTDVVLLTNVLAGSDKAMPAIEASLKNLDWRGAKSVKIDSPPPEAKAPPWVTMQLRYEPKAIWELLSKGPAKKAE